MNQTDSVKQSEGNNLIQQLKSYHNDFNSRENDIKKKYSIKIAELEKAQETELKNLYAERTAFQKEVSALGLNTQDKAKKTNRTNKKPIEDSKITSVLKDILKDGKSMKNAPLIGALGIGYPRFNKYTKDNGSVIVKLKAGWSLRS
jgi:hypothetical protein